MADIAGTGVGETILGTGDADTIRALGGNDTVNAGGGNDTIYGGTGNDTLNGEDGDDTFIEDEFTTPLDIFNGGSGFDTIELRAAPIPIATNVGPLTPHSLNGTGQMSSIERIVFASQVGQTVQATLAYGTWAASGITQIVGGAGRDILTVSVGGLAGTYTMQALPISGWDGPSLNAWEHTGDIVVLSAGSGPTITITLNALNGATFMQFISGGLGNDFLNGSGNGEVINASAGADMVNAGGGNDSIMIINTATPSGGFGPPTQFSGAGGVWDGGTGTDVVSIGGTVYLQATLVSIEGIQLQAAFIPPVPNTNRQDAAVLTLDSAHIAMLPGNAFFTGIGTVIFDLDDGASFNAAGYTFVAGHNVNFEIAAGLGNGITVTGSSLGDLIRLGEGAQTAFGGNGADLIVFGIGNQVATGGAGADRFQVGAELSTVTDFTIGEDRIDFSDTGISSMARLYDLSFSQAGSVGTILTDSGGVHFELALQNVVVANLTASDFLFDSGGRVNFDFGSGFDDQLYGFALNDQLRGGDGNDRLYGGGGVDQLFGDGGNDTIILDGAIGSGGIYDGGAGTDTLLLRAHSGSVANGPATQYLLFPGAPGTGLFAIERLVFDSSAAYALTLQTTTTPGFNEVVGGAGVDSLVLVAVAGGTYTMPAFTLTNWSSTDRVILAAASSLTAAVTLNGRNDISQLLNGALGSDTLNGGALADLLYGGGGDDILTGGGGADQLYGQAGNDRLVVGANSGGSTIDGGTETDTLVVSGLLGNLAGLTSIEAVELVGGAQLQLTGIQFNAGLAFNTVLSGTGVIAIQMNADTTFVAAQFTNAIGANVAFNVVGTSGIDVIKGSLANAITVSGGDGADQIRGSNLGDTILGDGGNDKIMGMGGVDNLTGGAGADQFRYLFTSDTGLGVGADRILDFTAAEDKLDFRTLDANPALAGRQALSFVGTAAFVVNGLGQVRYETSGADLLVSIDYNGDGNADAQIVLVGDGGGTLAGTDFLF